MPYDKNINGWMLESELKVLEKLAQSVSKHGTIVEVGSMFGRSSVCLAMSAPTSTVYCIDTFDDSVKLYNNKLDDIDNKFPVKNKLYNLKEEFINNTKNISNIVAIEGFSPNIDYNGGEIDLFFLDAEHSNPGDWNNLCHFIPMIKSEGIVCGHDYLLGFPDVIKNVNILEKIFNITVKLYDHSSIWSFQLPRKISREELISEFN